MTTGTYIIKNMNHPWHNEIVIVRKVLNNGFVEAEFLGSVKLIPENWLEKLEC